LGFGELLTQNGQRKMKASSKRLVDLAYEKIEEMIVTLQLPPGHAFSEGELADKLGYGRTPVREALQRLIMEHLVVSIPRKGMVIADINISDFMSLLQTRQLLDEMLVKQAVDRANATHQADLKRIAKGMTEAAEKSDVALFMQLDRQFDTIVFDASRNNYAAQVVLPLHAHSRRFWYYFKRSDDLTLPAKLHMEVMQGIIDKNEEAAVLASNKLIEYMIAFAKEALGF
jgi:DNA-binding GntR family transcriptional regulator